jgi:hypothetical protein
MGAILLPGCGGGGGNGGSTATYPFVTPAVASQRSYAQTIVDNAGNSIDERYTDTVLAANADGSFVVQHRDPTNTSVTVNGTTYSVTPETVTIDASGRDLSYTYAQNGNSISCSYNPQGPGPEYPVSVGQTWSTSFTLACGGGSGVGYTQSGTVEDVESLTVPAGTFSAIKLQSTLVWTNPAGTTRTETIIRWRDAATGQALKEVSSLAYSGTPLTSGYPVTVTIALQSQQ